MIATAKTIKKRFKEFVDKNAKALIKNVKKRKYKIMMTASIGVLVHQIDLASEEDVKRLIIDLFKKKEEVYQTLEYAKRGEFDKINVEVKNKGLLIQALPYLQQLLSDDNNFLKRVLDDFYKEFSDVVVDETENSKK